MENNNQQQNVVTQTSRFAMISVMLCFFAMGFVDLVGTASNYVKQDLGAHPIYLGGSFLIL